MLERESYRRSLNVIDSVLKDNKGRMDDDFDDFVPMLQDLLNESKFEKGRILHAIDLMERNELTAHEDMFYVLVYCLMIGRKMGIKTWVGDLFENLCEIGNINEEDLINFLDFNGL
jgi:hypothetical protein